MLNAVKSAPRIQEQRTSALSTLTLADITKELIEILEERGELKKSEVLELWNLDESAYPELQNMVLAKPNVEKGPKKTGGFKFRNTLRKPPTNTQSERILLDKGWQQAAAKRLQELLSYSQLEDLLGNLRNSLRQVRRAETGEDRRGTAAEFANALIVNHGTDLLSVPEIRKAVAQTCNLKAPGRWHPGKQAAIDFVKQSGFPAELEGIPTLERPPDYEYLEGRPVLGSLKPFQEEVKRELRQTMCIPAGKALLTLPTGAGKTRVAVEAIRDWLTDQDRGFSLAQSNTAVLWLAHTEELCEQAYTCFKEIWDTSEHVCPLMLIRFWGSYTSNLTSHQNVLTDVTNKPSVLISTPQRIVNLLSQQSNFSNTLGESLGVLVIDEAHRAGAPSYKHIIQSFSGTPYPPVTIGLTATPFRMEYLEDAPDDGTKMLQSIFENLIEPRITLGHNARRRLQDRGILAKPIFRTIRTPAVVNMARVLGPQSYSEDDAEKIDRILANRVDKSSRRLEVLRNVRTLAEDPESLILYFGPSVQDAVCMTYLLRRYDIPAAAVHADTKNATRRRLIRDFKAKRIKVLCNCQVLTTGFDAPDVTHIVIARPTISRVLYEQMVGRGLRGPVFGGTPECVIVDCEDDLRGRRPKLGYEEFREIWKN